MLSVRNRAQSPRDKSRALPFNGLLGAIGNLGAIRAKARRIPAEAGHAFAAGLEERRPRIESRQPDEPYLDPLYLFLCCLLWRNEAHAGAGWELVRCVRSSGQASQIAAQLLAETEGIKLPAQDLGKGPAPSRRASAPNRQYRTSGRRW